MENIFKSNFQIYLFLIIKLTLTSILICIFLIESERLNYMPTAYLKLEQREILRKNVDVFILFFWWCVVLFLLFVCFLYFHDFQTVNNLIWSIIFWSTQMLFFFLSVIFSCFRGRIPEVSQQFFFFLEVQWLFFFIITWPIATGGLGSYQLVKGFNNLFNCIHYGGD